MTMIIGIVAVDQRGAIGKGGKLPWHYSADMRFFKETTTGHACVMGHKTWLTLKTPLPDRLNVILSRQSAVEAHHPSRAARLGTPAHESIIVLKNLDSVLSLSRYLRSDLFVIGGEKIYRSFLPYIEKWIVTEVPLRVEGADAFVPDNYLEGFGSSGSRQLEEDLVVKFYERL